MGPTLRERGRAINSTEDVSPERAARRGCRGAGREQSGPRMMKNGTFVTSQPQPFASIALVLPGHFAAFEKPV